MRTITPRIVLPSVFLILGFLLGVAFVLLSQEDSGDRWWKDRSQIRAIYIALRAFQESNAYDTKIDASGGEWLIFDDHADQSLYRLLTDLGNAPIGGYLTHVPEDSVQDGVFVNPWGKPYVAAIYAPEYDEIQEILVKSGFARGKDGSIIFVFSKLEIGGYGMFFMDEGIPPNLEEWVERWRSR